MNSTGLLVPPLTPFTSGLDVDYGALRRGVDYAVDRCQASMVLVAGVEVQEYHYLSLSQRKDLIARTLEYVDRRTATAVGISHPSYRTAIELARFAEEQGADAVQLLAPLRPFGGQPSQAELLDYFGAVAQETSLPIMLYLNPGPGADASVDTTVALARLEQVKYVKESSRNLTRVGQLIVEIDRAGLAEYYTTMQMLLISLQLGGSGVTVPPPAAELCLKIVTAFRAGDMEEAARLQGQLALFPARWMHHGLLPVMKAAMQVIGESAGDPYPPFQPIRGREYEELAACLHATDLTKKE
jgi:4-hydroxy-tetrahydrodipicolinate synthase